MRDTTMIERKKTISNNIGFILSIVLLCGLGFTTLYFVAGSSAQKIFGDEAYFVRRQLGVAIFGIILCFFISVVDMDFLRIFSFPLVLVAILMCILTIIPGIGIEKNGARRWLGFGQFVFQPAEISKFIIVCYLAHILDKKKKKIDENILALMPAVTVLLTFVFLIYLQDDFSSTIFIFLIGLILFYFAGVSTKMFFAILILAIPVAVLFVFTEPYRVYRIISYLKPNIDPLGINYQILAAQNAIRSGGFWGRGIGGILLKQSIIPEVQSDFIFAGWTEESGFLGVLFYFGILIYMFKCGLYIALECPNRFRSFLVIGSISAIFFQSVINCGVVSGVFPSTGIPLPFFSSGGTSFATSLALCGLVINVSKWNLKKKYNFV